MRVPNKIMFDTSTYRLGRLNKDLYKANEVMSTGKRINHIDDDPVGLSQVMHLKSSVSSLQQLEKNISAGKTWLNATDAALDSMKDLVTEVNLEISKLITASAGPQERKDAVERIDGMLRQIVDLGNTQVNGNYIFGGSRTDKPPFIYHDSENPPRVSYEGDHEAFRIRTGDGKSMEVGRDGSKIFYMNHVEVNKTNNTLVFQEDNGQGVAFLKTMEVEIPTGVYTEKELAFEVEKRMNALSEKEGYGLSYAVDYNPVEKSFFIRERGGPGKEYIRTEILWSSGGEPRIENATVKGSIPPEKLEIFVHHPASITKATEKDKPFGLFWDGEGSFIVDNDPGYRLPGKITPENGVVRLDLSDNGFSDIEIKVDMDGIKKGDSITFSMVSFTGNTSIGREMGFYGTDTVLEKPVSTEPVNFITAPLVIDATNQRIEFAETRGNVRQVFSVDIPVADYSDMNELAGVIKNTMETASEAANPGAGISYAVTYDEEKSRFFIREDGGTLTKLEMLWLTGPDAGENSAGAILGFTEPEHVLTYPMSRELPVLFDIGLGNNIINFEETVGGTESGQLTAEIPPGDYRSITDLETAVSGALTAASANGVVYTATYDAVTRKFSIDDGGATDSVNFLWESGSGRHRSMAKVLGYTDDRDVLIETADFPYTANGQATLFAITENNNTLDFQEVDENGRPGAVHTIRLPERDYANPHELAAHIQTEMRTASHSGIRYVVDYDPDRGFSIRGGKEGVSETRLLWHTGPNAGSSMASTLGFLPYEDDITIFAAGDRPIVRIDVNDTNNRLDFREVMKKGDHTEFCELTALIPPGVYESMDDLALAVETALEKESRDRGFGIRYSVNYDEDTGKFSIKEKDERLYSLDLLFETGNHGAPERGGSGQSIAGVLGFPEKDVSSGPMESNRDVEWSLFRTLNDLMADLAANDVQGMQQGMQRLETSFKQLNSLHADTGIKFNRLEIQEKIQMDMKFSLEERRSHLEDADMIEAIMKLQSRELAYQAAMNSTSKVMKMSLMDYM
ncbi:flagellar hook-associated protein 3 [Desulfobotulus alkaliphilus]|uniref:Flagellar hook-associated protein 3 n=1 Tax=Desulfobotulus alkaliphilus TaxID=622671 RepID=A0A562RUW5_9BACT|nr:flagellar hook-associated protein FlgL [Desulfobotulus alkaliphilus]TWI72384.1 flagellar hook-associated protein 3 [Desulfobotulus alkaliphilus]